MRLRGIIVCGVAVLAVSAGTVFAIASLPVQTSGAVAGLAPISISPTSAPTTTPSPEATSHDAQPGSDPDVVAPAPAVVTTPTPTDDHGGGTRSGKGSSGGGSDDGGTSGSGKGGG